MKLNLFLFSVLIALHTYCIGQENLLIENQKIKISGKVIDLQTGYPLANLMIINKRTSTGIFGAGDGKFSVFLLKNDTLIFSVIEYETKTLCFKDSVFIDLYEIVIPMNKLNIDLQQINVFPERTLSEIQHEIDGLGTDYKYQVQGFEGLYSPITFLYERFSRFEKQRKKAAELYNEDNIKALLKELFKKYIKAEIIELNEKDFEEFIVFCNLSEEFIKNATQYELTMAVKARYVQYLIYKDR
ncbi:MAG: carboxypeptidase-like regulatory domain-containing protein [Bacteroidota bacterium]|nr:carboxypeptidase-like regulatory domain-containing protein [Bacteroidota bacterium]